MLDFGDKYCIIDGAGGVFAGDREFRRNPK
jgi:hypothetical protein